MLKLVSFHAETHRFSNNNVGRLMLFAEITCAQISGLMYGLTASELYRSAK
jgi:hypothetical protein